MNEIYAKSKNKETLHEHTQKLLNNFEKLKETGYLDSGKLTLCDAVRKILYYHDLGKLNHKFQNKIRKVLKLKPTRIDELTDDPEIPHEWLSLAFISKADREFFRQFNQENIRFNDLAEYCIAFHHTRKADRQFDKSSYERFVRYDLEKNKERIGITQALKSTINIDAIKNRMDDRFRDYFQLLVFCKGILHKCDYSASADIEPENLYQGSYREDFQGWLATQKIELRDYQKQAREYSDKSVIFIASTGAGKTEFSMNWINGSKAFYLLGIRIAVNEMYKRFEKIFGSENTSLLHGNTAYFLADETDDEDTYFERMAKARQLSYPLTIATADQLVTSVFKYNCFELTYLTASYSKIVVDEIQSFAPAAIAAIVVFLKEIHSLGGKFLLMTATIPPFIRKEFESLHDTVFPAPALSSIRRHRVKCISQYIEDSQSIRHIQSLADRNKKILVICNTVRKAQMLYEELKNDNPHLLHSRFIHRDRRKKESDIMVAADKTNTQGCIWISTQIVEASLDIDFDVLFTECSTIDSLFQRFGRCFRQREYLEKLPNIYIFQYDVNSKRIYDSELAERTWNILQQYDLLLLTEEDKQNIIDSVFSSIEDTKYYQEYKKRKEFLAFDIRVKNKAEAEELFRDIINNFVVIPEPVYKEHQDLIESLIREIETEKGIDKIRKKKELFEYSFSAQIYRSKHQLIREIDSKFCRKNRIVMIKGVEYSFEKGMCFSEQYQDNDNFIW